MTKWELDAKIDKLIENNLSEGDFDETFVNQEQLKTDIIDLIKSLSFTDLTKIHEMI